MEPTNRIGPIPPANGWSESLPCRFEESPPYQRWSICRASFHKLSIQPIRFLHYHMEMEIGLCVSGTGTLYLGDMVIPFRAGDVQIILPYQTHYNVATDENTQWRFLSFDPTSLQSAHMHPDMEFLQKILSDCHLSGIFPPDKFPALAQSLTSATDLALSPSVDPFSEDCLLTELVHFLVLLSRTERTDINVMQQINTESNRLMPALIAFSKELRNGRCLTIEEMANICHFSPSYFRKRFSELMGTHPKHFIIREQVRRAALLLITTNLPISEIQRQVGFSDPSAFFRNFTQRYHLSPTAYRKQNAGKPPDSLLIY